MNGFDIGHTPTLTHSALGILMVCPRCAHGTHIVWPWRFPCLSIVPRTTQPRDQQFSLEMGHQRTPWAYFGHRYHTWLTHRYKGCRMWPHRIPLLYACLAFTNTHTDQHAYARAYIQHHTHMCTYIQAYMQAYNPHTYRRPHTSTHTHSYTHTARARLASIHAGVPTGRHMHTHIHTYSK